MTPQRSLESTPRWASARQLYIGAGVGAVALTLALWPVETHVGTSYGWSSRDIPLYEKVSDFVQRDLETRRIIATVVPSDATHQVKALAILEWVNRQVKPPPRGFPIIDDHIVNVLRRGYGAEYQQTEVFALLASYAGMPAGHLLLQTPPELSGRHIALVEMAHRIYVFDVVNHTAFVRRDGTLADVATMASDPGSIYALVEGKLQDASEYRPLFASASRLRPSFTRMEMQKPWPRVKIELAALFGN